MSDQKSNGETVLGKIVVHDRVKVESSVLPRYFNHSSFASLRRQLNYFSFTRNGKGRQRGATYCNEGVIELEDILNLKRRSVTGGSVPAPAPSALVKTISKTSSVSSAPKRKDLSKENPKKRIRTKSRNETHGPSELAVRTEISPIASFVSSDEEHTSSEQPKIALDLTITSTTPAKSFPPAFRPMTVLQDASCRFPPYDKGDEDLLAGCRALLNFSKGISSR